ncbi:MAG TPA: hypothetical protein PKX07_22575 [Aggregatilineales bacterium]|jgi:hypothetical protein|nr:hypothetical protein [Aggregatilineales bacterium]
MLRIILALVIGAHGIGHILFLIPLLGIAEWGQPQRSWLLTGESAARVIGGALWVVVILAFGAAVIGLLGQQGWWRTAAVIGAVISMIGLVLFWTMPVSAPVISALVFNLLVLGALLIVHWPSVDAVGA